MTRRRQALPPGFFNATEVRLGVAFDKRKTSLLARNACCKMDFHSNRFYPVWRLDMGDVYEVLVEIMSYKARICIERFHRDEISIDKTNLERLGWAFYRWAILVRPKDLKQIDNCTSFDVTNGVRLDPVNWRNLNPTGDWWFRVREMANPLRSGHSLSAIEIGKLPKDITTEQLHTLLSTLPLPQREQTPDQSCATWVYHAVQAPQQAGYVPEKDTQKIMSMPMVSAREVMSKGPPKKVEDLFQVL